VPHPSPLERVYHVLVAPGPGDPDEPSERLADDVPRNALKQVAALTLQKVGDLVVDARTVLSWLLAAVGAPAGFVGLLVPIRESGSMLPQVALVPWIRRLPRRKWVWVVGGVLQALATLAMALVAATTEGVAAGIGILAALTVLALARSLSSIASKDVLGRTVPKGSRGQINGLATVGAGIAAITVGLAMRSLGAEATGATVFAWLLLGAATAWLAAVAVYATIAEDAGEHDPGATARDSLRAVGLLRDDAPFRRFVVARTLLLVSALTPPFVVVLATERGGSGLAGLGPFVLSSGVASLIGGRLWGRLSDRSSRRVMMLACGAASAVVLLFLALLRVEPLAEQEWLYPATYLLLALAHTGSRIGRKTYVVDLAEGDRRTDYVAVSNTAMGVLLLVTGAVTAGVATLGVEAALGLLAVLGVAGVLVSRSLPEVTGP
jgi:predicted MFS family arabinose efflux permease